MLSYDGPMQIPNKRHKKIGGKPKRAISAFLSYSHQMRNSLRSQHPGLKNSELCEKLAERWLEASEEEKRPHLNREYQDRERYLQEMKKWEGMVSFKDSLSIGSGRSNKEENLLENCNVKLVSVTDSKEPNQIDVAVVDKNEIERILDSITDEPWSLPDRTTRESSLIPPFHQRSFFLANHLNDSINPYDISHQHPNAAFIHPSNFFQLNYGGNFSAVTAMAYPNHFIHTTLGVHNDSLRSNGSVLLNKTNQVSLPSSLPNNPSAGTAALDQRISHVESERKRYSMAMETNRRLNVTQNGTSPHFSPLYHHVQVGRHYPIDPIEIVRASHNAQYRETHSYDDHYFVANVPVQSNQSYLVREFIQPVRMKRSQFQDLNFLSTSLQDR
jgi:hypothetical protein